ncbi:MULTISPECIES: hypothetical protein [unclassified Marinimicrobium]|jgi:hypothetical protein|uniref:hypothetical protein n=1 Tax=unclassified Marinimicrobium TaxID=2632100 RepID=UPI000C57C8AA|nr:MULTISPECIES: hypothetical protein [unclassified Marinimicrobium]MAN51217.1 hypothetical protein [Marinimicrobium sp.]
MPYEIGFVENVGTLAHYMMLDKIRSFALASGFWQVLRYDDTIDNRELILKGEGYSGTEEIFVGFRCYQNASADVYNMTVAGFTGYVAGNSFASQPGAILLGLPAHNNRIDYWLTVNPQRIALAMKVGTPVYESAYAGKFLPYATPSQYPYPVFVGGMLTNESETRFSDSSHSMYAKGNRDNCRMRFNDGTWRVPDTWPWVDNQLTSSENVRDTDGNYPLLPVMLNDSQGIYGELDGIFHISGFNNAVENTLTVGGDDYVVIQDVSRTGFADYYALRLDPNV